jgi:hypothetical protein
MTGIFCGKLFGCPVRAATDCTSNQRNPHKYGVVTSIHRQAAQQHGRVVKRTPAIAREKTHGKIAHRADKRETCTPGKQARRRMRRNFFENLC